MGFSPESYTFMTMYRQFILLNSFLLLRPLQIRVLNCLWGNGSYSEKRSFAYKLSIFLMCKKSYQQRKKFAFALDKGLREKGIKGEENALLWNSNLVACETFHCGNWNNIHRRSHSTNCVSNCPTTKCSTLIILFA